VISLVHQFSSPITLSNTEFPPYVQRLKEDKWDALHERDAAHTQWPKERRLLNEAWSTLTPEARTRGEKRVEDFNAEYRRKEERF